MREEVQDVIMQHTLKSIEHASLKRIAWAYGCAKKGTETERLLLAALVERIQGGQHG